MLFARLLLNYMCDISAFKVVYAIGVVSYLTQIFFSSSPNMVYLANVAMLASIGGWGNINSLILELRVPPSNVAEVFMLVRTLSVSSGILAPSVAYLRVPYSFMVLLVISTCGLIASLKLPEPGEHLLAVEHTEDNRVKLVDRKSESNVALPHAQELEEESGEKFVTPTNFGLHAMSHRETYIERKLRV